MHYPFTLYFEYVYKNIFSQDLSVARPRVAMGVSEILLVTARMLTNAWAVLALGRIQFAQIQLEVSYVIALLVSNFYLIFVFLILVTTFQLSVLVVMNA